MFDAVKCDCCGSTFPWHRLCRDNTGKPCCPHCGNYIPDIEFPNIPFEPTMGCKVNISQGVESVTLTFVKKDSDEFLTSICLSLDDAECLGFSIVDACIAMREGVTEGRQDCTADKSSSGSLKRLIGRMRP